MEFFFEVFSYLWPFVGVDCSDWVEGFASDEVGGLGDVFDCACPVEGFFGFVCVLVERICP